MKASRRRNPPPRQRRPNRECCRAARALPRSALLPEVRARLHWRSGPVPQAHSAPRQQGWAWGREAKPQRALLGLPCVSPSLPVPFRALCDPRPRQAFGQEPPIPAHRSRSGFPQAFDLYRRAFDLSPKDAGVWESGPGHLRAWPAASPRGLWVPQPTRSWVLASIWAHEQARGFQLRHPRRVRMRQAQRLLWSSKCNAP